MPVKRVERSEENDVLLRKMDNELIQPGTSLGGARPKAGVIDEKRQSRHREVSPKGS